MKTFKFCITALVTALLYQSANAQSAVTLGMSAPLSGGNAALGKEISEGALAYFRKVNAEGGVQGRSINLVVLDDKNDRATAGANAKKLLTENKAIGLFGFASATLTLDAIAAARELKAPIIAPFSGADTLRQADLPVYLLRASYEQEFEKLAGYWQTMGFTNAVILHYDDEVGKQNFETAKRALAKQNKVAVSVAVKRNQKVSAKEVEAIKAANSPVIINTMLYAAFTDVLQALRATSNPYLYYSISFVGASQLVDAAKGNTAGVIMAHVVPYPGNRNIPVVKECGDAMKSAGYGEMGFASLESCIAAKAVVEAMKRSKSSFSKEGLSAALEGLGKADLGGFLVNLSNANKFGSNFVDLSVVSKQGTFRN
jgi:branched-chain amino acid transport system substrate-binding protein